MFGFKLFGLALSALLSVTPVNRYSELSYPLTRQDQIFYRMSYRIDDLGTTTANGNTHNYDIHYDVDIYCSSACSLSRSNRSEFSESHVTYSFTQRVMNVTSETMVNKLTGLTTANYYNATNTYTNEFDVSQNTFTITYHDNKTQNITVFIMAEPPGASLKNIEYLIDEFSNLYFMRNFLLDKDVPSTDIQTVQNYIDNGDYNSAYQYITNYYYTNSVTNNENNEDVVNNYSTKETSLNTYYNTENNFTNQVETDFQQQEQQLPDLNDSIQELQVPKFLQSANWVTAQFNRMTSGNALGSLITFSLLTGFILALIGRFKR